MQGIISRTITCCYSYVWLIKFCIHTEHKYEIVKRLQARKHICGMTGDGVNDAPALKKADIGIAVADATDAARSASDIVLTEPGLSVIISAVLTSRAIFQRMKNYTVSWVLFECILTWAIRSLSGGWVHRYKLLKNFLAFIDSQSAIHRWQPKACAIMFRQLSFFLPFLFCPLPFLFRAPECFHCLYLFPFSIMS